MAFDKVVDARLFGVTNQASSVRIPLGDSTSGTQTTFANPMRGTALWDSAMYVIQGLSIAGGATGGSWSIYLESDALLSTTGVTGLPICGLSAGPLSATRREFTSFHQSSASPIPTHLNLIQHAGGTTGGIWLQCYVVAKQYRGTLSTVGAQSAERVIQGNMLRQGTLSADTTFAVGTSASDLGLRKMRMWDSALYWFTAGNSLSGTHDMHIIGRMPSSGATFTIARTGTNGVLAAAGGKRALSNLFFGPSVAPSHLIWDVISAGGISDARVIVLAKTGRGSMGKA